MSNTILPAAAEERPRAVSDPARRPGRHLPLWWTLASVAAILVSLPVAFLVLAPIAESMNVPFLIGFPVLLGFVAAVYGTAQWLVLRRRLTRSGAWVGTSALGLTMGFAIVIGLLGEGTGLVGKIIEGLEHGAVLGALTGILQWLMLRRRIPAAGWWVVISTLAWSVGAACGDTVGFFFGGPFDVATGFSVAALLTGIGISVLLRRRAVLPAAAQR